MSVFPLFFKYQPSHLRGGHSYSPAQLPICPAISHPYHTHLLPTCEPCWPTQLPILFRSHSHVIPYLLTVIPITICPLSSPPTLTLPQLNSTIKPNHQCSPAVRLVHRYYRISVKGANPTFSTRTSRQTNKYQQSSWGLKTTGSKTGTVPTKLLLLPSPSTTS